MRGRLELACREKVQLRRGLRGIERCEQKRGLICHQSSGAECSGPTALGL